MFGQTWEHDIIRKYVVLFGTLFNSIYVNRHNNEGGSIQTIKIPLNYGPKDKILSRLDGDPNLDRPIGITLPRMSFEMVNINPAPERMLNKKNKIYSESDEEGSKSYRFQEVPYDFHFSLYVMTKNVTDGTRIIEQILPFFTPQWSATVDLIEGVAENIDIPIIFNDISTEDSYEGNYEIRRAIIHTLNFTMKGFLYGPVRTSKVIKDIDVIFKLSSESSPITANTALANNVIINVQPGLTANGDPTSNASLSIDSSLINPDDDYGFIIDIDENL